MKKHKPMRILREWNTKWYTDFGENLSWAKRTDDGVILVNEAGVKYTIKFPHANRFNHQRESTEPNLIYETNLETGLLHEYLVVPNCALYRAGKLINNNTFYITFERTVIEEDEYAGCIQTNWNPDPFFGDSFQSSSEIDAEFPNTLVRKSQREYYY